MVRFTSLKTSCRVRIQVELLKLKVWSSSAWSGHDYRADLKEAHTAIVRAHDEGELSHAAAQLNGVLRRKFTRDGRSGHGHSGVYALYADAASHLADLRAVAISADYVTLLRDAYAIDPIAHIVRVRTAAIVVARRGMFGRLIRQMVTLHTTHYTLRRRRGGGGGGDAAATAAAAVVVQRAQRQRRSVQ